MDLHVSTMSNVFRVASLPIIFDIHDGATIVAISMVDDMLDSSIRKVDLVLSLDITSLISRPYFTKVCNTCHHELHTGSGKDLVSHHNDLHHVLQLLQQLHQHLQQEQPGREQEQQGDK